MMVRAKYDSAQTTALNRNHWSRADNLSADAGLQPHVRQTLRNRARYELRNNSYAAGIAESGLLASRAARFPQQELLWDKSKLAFANADGSPHDEANNTCVRREYRKGFELPAVV